MAKNIKGLIERNEKLKAEKEASVKKALEKLRKSGKEFSIATVCREANVSRQYLHDHPDLLELVYKYTNTSSRPGKRNKDTIETHIALLRKTIRDKDREIENMKKEYECNEKYKEKYEEALTKIKTLEKQLDEAYSMNLPTTL